MTRAKNPAAVALGKLSAAKRDTDYSALSRRAAKKRRDIADFIESWPRCPVSLSDPEGEHHCAKCYPACNCDKHEVMPFQPDCPVHGFAQPER